MAVGERKAHSAGEPSRGNSAEFAAEPKSPFARGTAKLGQLACVFTFEVRSSFNADRVAFFARLSQQGRRAVQRIADQRRAALEGSSDSTARGALRHELFYAEPEGRSV
jgi:hypothetical protein